MNHDLELLSDAREFYSKIYDANGQVIELKKPSFIRFCKLSINVLRPVRNPLHEGFWDLFVGPEFRTELKPGETVDVPTSLLIEIPKGYVGKIFTENDFLGDFIKVEERFITNEDKLVPLTIPVTNIATDPIMLRPYIRFAQLLLLPCCMINELREVESPDLFYDFHL
jgi:dUTPase